MPGYQMSYMFRVGFLFTKRLENLMMNDTSGTISFYVTAYLVMY